MRQEAIWDTAGLAWHPSENEIWFTAARKGGSRALWAVNRSGRLRQVAQAPGILTLRDISPSGRVLVSRDTRRLEMAGSIHGETPERSFSWLDWSRVQQLSADGSLVLFDESGEGAGDHSVAYVQRTRDHSVIGVGEGRAMGLTPDASSVLSLGPTDRSEFRLVSLNGGAPRLVSVKGLECQWARFFPDGRRLLLLASEPGKALRLYVHGLDRENARPVPITPEMMVRNVAISPDGERVAVLSADSKFRIYPTGGGEPTVVPTSESLAPIHWSRNANWILVQHLRSYSELPARISRLNRETGELQPWKDLAPSDPFGVTGVTGLALSADEKSYVYSYRRILAELFLVDGWR